MKILAVLPLIPWPLDRGDRMRAWELLKELSTRGDLTVALLTRIDIDSAAHIALGDIATSLHVFNVGSVVRNVFAGLVRGLPPAIGAYWRPDLARALRKVGDTPWDLVVAFQLRAAPYALVLPSSCRAIDFTDSLTMFRRQLPIRGRAGLQRLLLAGVERLETELPARFDVCWVSAMDDAQAISDLSGRRPEVIPNGCEPVTTLSMYHGNGPLLFLGDMYYPANEDGIVSFVSDVWPTVCRRNPGTRLHIVGRASPRVMRALSQPGVTVLGPLADVTSEIGSASAIINPVRFGSGSSRKVLAGWAAGRPVISTRAGARGLAYAGGEDLLLADTPAQWAEVVAWIRSNPIKTAEIGKAGWKRARAEHDAREVWRRALPDPESSERVAYLQGGSSGVMNWVEQRTLAQSNESRPI